MLMALGLHVLAPCVSMRPSQSRAPGRGRNKLQEANARHSSTDQQHMTDKARQRLNVSMQGRCTCLLEEPLLEQGALAMAQHREDEGQKDATR